MIFEKAVRENRFFLWWGSGLETGGEMQTRLESRPMLELVWKLVGRFGPDWESRPMLRVVWKRANV